MQAHELSATLTGFHILHYSRVHISSDEDSEETIHSTEKNDTSYESLWSF